MLFMQYMNITNPLPKLLMATLLAVALSSCGKKSNTAPAPSTPAIYQLAGSRNFSGLRAYVSINNGVTFRDSSYIDSLPLAFTVISTGTIHVKKTEDPGKAFNIDDAFTLDSNASSDSNMIFIKTRSEISMKFTYNANQDRVTDFYFKYHHAANWLAVTEEIWLKEE